MRGDLLHFLFQALSCIIDRAAPNRRSTATIGAAPLWRRIRVTVHDQDIIDGNGELVRDDLSKGCLFTLSMRRRTRIDHHGAALFYTNARALIETDRRRPLRTKPADLDVGG